MGDQRVHFATACCHGRCCVSEGPVPAGVSLRAESRICHDCNHVVWPSGVVVRTGAAPPAR